MAQEKDMSLGNLGGEPGSHERDAGLPAIQYKAYSGPEDHEILLEIARKSEASDGMTLAPGLDDIVAMCEPTARFLPSRDLDIAYVAKGRGSPEPAAFSKRSWYSGFEGIPLYCQYSCLAGDFRTEGVWRRIFRRNEALLRELASVNGGGAGGGAMFQAWSTDCEKDWIALLDGEGYKLVRSFHNMKRATRNAPELALPSGFELRRVEEGHLRAIWEGQRDMNLGLFECVTENWTEGRYPAWAEASRGKTELWQVAWRGDEAAGMVLAHHEPGTVGADGLSRGYTEHIYVKPAFRGRGLAAALIAASLRALAARGVEMAELGVDSRNESVAFDLYRRMGYETESIDGWHRKAL